MKLRLQCAVCTCLVLTIFPVAANAALLPRLGGLAVYDTDRNITWLADANYAATNTFGVAIATNGDMTLNTANNWITAMNADGGTGYLGFNDWRLPTTLVPDSSCSSSSSESRGFNCTGSEMGHLFYNEFGAAANTSVLTTGDPTELSKFTNIQSGIYWSGTEIDPTRAWAFNFNVGGQDTSFNNRNYFAWAVRSGDVSAIPIPATVWLFGSGLVGLLGAARKVIN